MNAWYYLLHSVARHMQWMLRLDSPYIGIVPDTSLFMRRPPRIVGNYCKELFGIKQELIDYAEEVFASGTDFFALTKKYGHMDPKLEAMVETGQEMFYASNLEGYENRSLFCMDGLEKYIKHFHFNSMR